MSVDNAIEVFLLKSKGMEPSNLQKDWVTQVILFLNTTPVLWIVYLAPRGVLYFKTVRHYTFVQ